MQISLPFTMQQQNQTFWCWAAGSVSIERFYGSSGWSQCDLANAEFSRRDCCYAGGNSDCNRPGRPDQALTRIGCFRGWRPDALTVGTLVKELSEGSPVGVGIHWRQGGHFVVATGIDVTTSMVEIADPLPPHYRKASYSAVCQAYNGTQGEWRETFLTQPGQRSSFGRPMPSYRYSVVTSATSAGGLPMFTTELSDVVAGSPLDAARRTGTLRLLGDGLRVSGNGGEITEYSDDTIERDLRELGEKSAGLDRELWILQIPALYVTAAWLPSDADDIVIPIGHVPPFLEHQRWYDSASFTEAVRPEAIRRLDYVDDERRAEAELASTYAAVDPEGLELRRLAASADWQRGPYELVAASWESEQQWNSLRAREPVSARETFERLSSYPHLEDLPSRQFPLRGKALRGLWQFQVTPFDVLRYRIDDRYVALTI